MKGVPDQFRIMSPTDGYSVVCGFLTAPNLVGIWASQSGRAFSLGDSRVLDTCRRDGKVRDRLQASGLLVDYAGIGHSS